MLVLLALVAGCTGGPGDKPPQPDLDERPKAARLVVGDPQMSGNDPNAPFEVRHLQFNACHDPNGDHYPAGADPKYNKPPKNRTEDDNDYDKRERADDYRTERTKKYKKAREDDERDGPSCKMGNRPSEGIQLKTESVSKAILNYKPDIVTLNETCLKQLPVLEKLLAAGEWPMKAHNRGGADRSCGPVGTAVLVHSDSSNVSDVGEDTKVLCVEAKWGRQQQAILACAVHMEKTGVPAIAAVLNREVKNGRPIVLGGDFNLDGYKEYGLLDPLQKNFADADHASPSPTNCRHYKEDDNNGEFLADCKGKKKLRIDYVFYSRDHFGYWDANVVDSEYSDHRIVQATAVLTAKSVSTPPSERGGIPEAITAGYRHTCTLTADGSVRCWGADTEGTLGQGNTTRKDSSRPVTVTGLSDVTAISAGSAYTCALLRDTTVRCWGTNTWGQLGNGTTTNSSTPVPVTGLDGVTAITAGGYHACALVRDGTVRCWGYNASGDLGDGSEGSWGNNAIPGKSTPVAVTGLGGAKDIAAGDFHTCALLGDGTARCWGYDLFGQLGNGPEAKLGVVSYPTPVIVSGLDAGATISAAGDQTCALLRDGTARCWGNNSNGQVGNGTKSTTVTSPVSVSGLIGASAISVGDGHTCALSSSVGTVYCWGDNSSGQVGNGTTADTPSPVPVTGLSGARTIAAGAKHTCLLVGESARCWGKNDHGQLGNGTETDSSTPVVVTG